MIDRKARDAMSETIQLYMDDRIGSFKFDAALHEIAGSTQDESVRAVRYALWGLYSDIEDHKFVGSKQVWDYCNRLRLVLATETEAEWYPVGRRWSNYKTLSAVCLVGLVLVALMVGIGKVFMVCWLSSGLVASVLFWVLHHNNMKAWEPRFFLSPFPSVKFLRSVRRRAPNFARMRYPNSMSCTAKTHSYLDRMMWIVRIPLWLVVAPLALLVLALPIRQQEMRLKIPAENA